MITNKRKNLIASASFLAGSVLTCATSPNELVTIGGAGLGITACCAAAAEIWPKLKNAFMRAATVAAPVANMALIANGALMAASDDVTIATTGMLLALANIIYLVANTNGTNYFWRSEAERAAVPDIGIAPEAHGALSTVAATTLLISAGANAVGGGDSGGVLAGIGVFFLGDGIFRATTGESLANAFRGALNKFSYKPVLEAIPTIVQTTRYYIKKNFSPSV